MNYDRYTKEQLIVMLKRSEYIVDIMMELTESAQALYNLSYGEIDELIKIKESR